MKDEDILSGVRDRLQYIIDNQDEMKYYWSSNSGVCHVVWEWLEENDIHSNDRCLFSETLLRRWPSYSGDKVYPVMNIKGRGNWTGVNLEMRIDLCQFLIDNISKVEYIEDQEVIIG